MPRTVTATYKGERVYLRTKAYPRQVMLSLSVAPIVYEDVDEAAEVAALAAQDDSLTDVRVEGDER